MPEKLSWIRARTHFPELRLGWPVVIVLLLSCHIVITGCSLFPKREPEIKKSEPVKNDLVKFSDNPNMISVSDRHYKKMTRQRLEEESELNAQDGSMWVMEGQGAYLFAQNKARREGDILNVKIEGSAQRQVEVKVSVIKKLLKQLEEEEAQQKLKVPNQQGIDLGPMANKDGKNPDPGRNPAGEPSKPIESKPDIAKKGEGEGDKAEKEGPQMTEPVPTRIVERLGDGNYRLKGQQSFMIGKREYKIIVTGMIRPEDFNEDGVSSNRLLDAQFDVVSIRKKEDR